MAALSSMMAALSSMMAALSSMMAALSSMMAALPSTVAALSFDDGRAAIDDGRAAVDDGRAAVDGGRAVIDGGRAVIDGGRAVVDDKISLDPWLLHRDWRVLPARELVESPDEVLESVHATDTVFVRPDSPLKPFAGRVLPRGRITLAGLDHGFYYDDVEIPVVVAPTRSVRAEWRFVVVESVVVAGSRYVADGRTALPDDPTGAPWQFAADVAARLPAPEPVYVLDVCEADGRLWLLELNPFSGADLYGCSAG
jgi:ATP-grasp domain-containing protein